MRPAKLPTWFDSHADRSRFGWLALRVTLAILIGVHGIARWAAGGVVPFGGFLSSVGFPGGLYLAIAVTVIEIVGSLSLAAGRLVPLLCVLFSLIYVSGIALVHAKAGWFVVGLGRNGSEYSVLLIVCLLSVGLQHVKVGSRR